MPRWTLAVLAELGIPIEKFREAVATEVNYMNRQQVPVGENCGSHCGNENGRVGHCLCDLCHGRIE